MIDEITRYTCDICGKIEESRYPTDWIEYNITESSRSYEERTFIVCSFCEESHGLNLFKKIWKKFKSIQKKKV